MAELARARRKGRVDPALERTVSIAVVAYEREWRCAIREPDGLTVHRRPGRETSDTNQTERQSEPEHDDAPETIVEARAVLMATLVARIGQLNQKIPGKTLRRELRVLLEDAARVLPHMLVGPDGPRRGAEYLAAAVVRLVGRTHAQREAAAPTSKAIPHKATTPAYVTGLAEQIAAWHGTGPDGRWIENVERVPRPRACRPHWEPEARHGRLDAYRWHLRRRSLGRHAALLALRLAGFDAGALNDCLTALYQAEARDRDRGKRKGADALFRQALGIPNARSRRGREAER